VPDLSGLRNEFTNLVHTFVADVHALFGRFDTPPQSDVPPAAEDTTPEATEATHGTTTTDTPA